MHEEPIHTLVILNKFSNLAYIQHFFQEKRGNEDYVTFYKAIHNVWKLIKSLITKLKLN